jgi:hypothetical protein
MNLKYTNPDITPPFVHRNLWRYIEGGGKSKYCTRENFSYQIFHGRSTVIWMYVG